MYDKYTWKTQENHDKINSKIGIFLKVAGYKINIQKLIALMYTNENHEEVLMMEENPIHNSNRVDKILTNKLTKECAKPIRR